MYSCKGLTLKDDPEPQFHEEASSDYVKARDLSWWEVLSHFQDPSFAEELCKFTMFGFHRRNRQLDGTRSMAPYGRAHVYKATVMNLACLQAVDYDPLVWTWEDLDFNKRTLCICHGNQLCRQCKGGEGPCEGSSDGSLDGRAVICKFRRFALTQKRNLGGGCLSDQPFIAKETPPLPAAAAPTQETAILDWLKSFLKKATDQEIEQIASKLDAAGYDTLGELQGFTQVRQIRDIEESLARLQIEPRFYTQIATVLKTQWP